MAKMECLWLIVVAMVTLNCVSAMDTYYMGFTDNMLRRCGQTISLVPGEEVNLRSDGGAPNGKCQLGIMIVKTTRCSEICITVENFTLAEDFVSIKFANKSDKNMNMREETLSLGKKSLTNPCFEGYFMTMTVTDKPGFNTTNMYSFHMIVKPLCPGASAELVQEAIDDSRDFETMEELKKAETLNYVYGIIVGVCLACVFLVILLITYCYYKNQPYSSQTYSKSAGGFKGKLSVNEPGMASEQTVREEYRKKGSPEAEPLVAGGAVAMSNIKDETK